MSLTKVLFLLFSMLDGIRSNIALVCSLFSSSYLDASSPYRSRISPWASLRATISLFDRNSFTQKGRPPQTR